MKIKHGELLYVEPNTQGIQPFAHCFGGSSITLAGEEFNVAQWIRQGDNVPGIAYVNHAQ